MASRIRWTKFMTVASSFGPKEPITSARGRRASSRARASWYSGCSTYLRSTARRSFGCGSRCTTPLWTSRSMSVVTDAELSPRRTASSVGRSPSPADEACSIYRRARESVAPRSIMGRVRRSIEVSAARYSLRAFSRSVSKTCCGSAPGRASRLPVTDNEPTSFS